MNIITSIENKGKDYIYTTQPETAIYIFTATTTTIRIKETRCMNITTHDYYKYIVLLTIVPIVVRVTTNIIYITNKMFHSIVV